MTKLEQLCAERDKLRLACEEICGGKEPCVCSMLREAMVRALEEAASEQCDGCKNKVFLTHEGHRRRVGALTTICNATRIRALIAAIKEE